MVTSNMRRKLAVTVAVIVLALFALLWKLYSIQDNYSDTYNQRILSQQRYDSRDIPSRRGDITDRNGTLLATSTKVYNLILDPSQINADQEAYLEPTVALLSEVFGYDASELRQIITEKAESAYIRYAKSLSYDEKLAFEDRKEEVNAAYKKESDPSRVNGVWFEEAYSRYYPNNSLACNVVGFAVSDAMEGSGGIEQYYNDRLTGTNGREYGYLNDDSNLERVIKPASDGCTVVSTIDVNIQKIVEKYIAKSEEELGSKTTACVIMDPDTGEVLAMAGNRPFDLNDPRDMSAYYTEEELASMSDQELSDLWNTVWRNYCVSDTYEPGSTSKIFTVATGLEEGTISGGETYLCDGFEEVGGWKIKCNVWSGHGLLTVTESIMQSCNDAMMQIVAGIGKERFSRYMSTFGFGKKTGIDLPGEPDTSQLVHTPENMVSSDLATNSFGQNYNCTMLQMASAYCSVLNGGTYYEPHVVKRILNAKGSVVEEMAPKAVCQTVSAKTSEFIKDALRRTVTEGTGSAAGIPGYDIGGKTGTGEKYPRGQYKYLVSFIGAAPMDDPQVLCYVIVDEPNTEDQAHSSFASTIFRNIMSEVLPYLNVYRENEDEYLAMEEEERAKALAEAAAREESIQRFEEGSEGAEGAFSEAGEDGASVPEGSAEGAAQAQQAPYEGSEENAPPADFPEGPGELPGAPAGTPQTEAGELPQAETVPPFGT